MKGTWKKVSWNAPVTLTFVFLCTGIYLLNIITGGTTNLLFFSVYRSSLLDPLTYIRLFGHVLGHVSWPHFLNNMMYILLLGPLLEEKYGQKDMIWLMTVTALITGAITMLFFPAIALSGASGIGFAMILLSSVASAQDGSIPLTFILVVVLFVGQQDMQMFAADNVSQLTHIIGGIIGAMFGFMMAKRRVGSGAA